MRPFDGRRLLLVVGGGIAAYKSAYLVRRLREAGARVDVLLTEAGGRFVGPVTFEGLTGRPVHRSLWERPLSHLDLGRDADLIVVAPATADLLAKLAHGIADDLAGTTLLAAEAPVLACPAMNLRMWSHPATRANVATLRDRGVRIVGPEEGELAEGETGPGRMSEPAVIVAEAGRALEPPSPLAGRRVVVTAGPTRSYLDPVRYLSNPSTGKMGYALAASAWRRGAEVVLIAGPSEVEPPHGPRLRRVEGADGMLGALGEELEGAECLLMAAAVTDFEAEEVRDSKIRKEEGGLELSLRPGPDLLEETRAVREEDGVFTLGFSVETDGGVERTRRKLERKGLDLIALNVAGRDGVGFGSDTNEVSLVGRAGDVEEIPLLSKAEVADRLLDRIEEALEE